MHGPILDPYSEPIKKKRPRKKDGTPREDAHEPIKGNTPSPVKMGAVGVLLTDEQLADFEGRSPADMRREILEGNLTQEEASSVWGFQNRNGLTPSERRQLLAQMPLSKVDMVRRHRAGIVRKLKVEISLEEKNFVKENRIYHLINCYRIVKQFCRWTGFLSGEDGKGRSLKDIMELPAFADGFKLPVSPDAPKLKRSDFAGTQPRRFMHNYVMARSLEKGFMGVYHIGTGFCPKAGLPFLHPPLPFWAWQRGKIDPTYEPSDRKDPLLSHWLECVRAAIEHLNMGEEEPVLMPELASNGIALLDDPVLARAVWPKDIDALVDIEEGIISEVMMLQDRMPSDEGIMKHLNDKYGFNREEIVHFFQMVTRRLMAEEELCDPDRAFLFMVRHFKKALNDAIDSGNASVRMNLLKQMAILTGSNRTGANNSNESFEEIMGDIIDMQDGAGQGDDLMQGGDIDPLGLTGGPELTLDVV